MPSFEEHCQHSARKYGYRGERIHRYMDDVSLLREHGQYHRQFRHDTETVKKCGELFGHLYGSRENAMKIALDHIMLDHLEEVRHETSDEIKIEINPIEVIHKRKEQTKEHIRQHRKVIREIKKEIREIEKRLKWARPANEKHLSLKYNMKQLLKKGYYQLPLLGLRTVFSRWGIVFLIPELFLILLFYILIGKYLPFLKELVVHTIQSKERTYHISVVLLIIAIFFTLAYVGMVRFGWTMKLSGKMGFLERIEKKLETKREEIETHRETLKKEEENLSEVEREERQLQEIQGESTKFYGRL